MNVRIVLFSLFLLGCSTTLLSQDNSNRNSANKSATSRSDNLERLQELAQDYLSINELDSASKITNVLCENAQRRNDQLYLAVCQDLGGTIEKRKGNYDVAAEKLQQAVEYYRANNRDFLLDDASFDLAICYQFLGKLDKSLKLAYENIEVAKRTGDDDVLAGTYQVIGNVNAYLENYSEAKEKYQSAIDLYGKLNDDEGQQYVYFAMALLYGSQGDLDSAVINATMSKQLAERVGNINEAMASTGYLAHLFTLQEDYKTAANLADKVLAHFRQAEEQDRLVSALITRATVHQRVGEYDQGIKLVDEALEYAKQTQSIYNLTNTFDLKIEMYLDSKDYKSAYETSLELAAVKDSIFQLEKVDAITEHEVKYQTEKKEKELLARTLEIRKVQFNNTLLVGGLVAATLFSLLFFYVIRQRQKAKEKIATKELEIKEEKIANYKKREKLLALEYMVVGQEKERERIAQDLHDGLGGLLSTVKAHVTNIQEQVKALESLNVVVKTNELVDTACEEVRRISHNMMPSAMRLGGLKQAVEEIVAQLRSAHGLHVDAELSGLDAPIQSDDAVILFRIIQELTNNIVKHAQAEHVLLEVHRFENELHIVVEDDGRGMNLERVEENEGLGLKSIRSRVKYLDGTVDFYSKPNEGLSTSINIPLA